MSIFSSYKSFLQREILSCAQRIRYLDAFDVSYCIKSTKSASMTMSNIISGFERTGIWCGEIISASIESLKHLFASTNICSSINSETLVDSFMKGDRSLIRDADFGDEGTVPINTKSSSSQTSDVVIDAFKRRDERRFSAKAPRREKRQVTDEYIEPAADI